MEKDTPLDTIRQDLWVHTDRNPVNNAEVLAMIGEAMSTLSDSEATDNSPITFRNSLIRSLDPEVPGGLGVANAGLLEVIGTLAVDDKTSRVQQWGALSLLGLLAMTHDPAAHEDSSTIDPKLYRAQLTSTLARKALNNLLELTPSSSGRAALIAAFLARTGVPTEDVAIELLDLPLSSAESKPEKDSKKAEARPTPRGQLVQETGSYDPAWSDVVQERLRQMHWIDGARLAQNPVTSHTIYHDGKKIGLILNLTTGHRTLEKLYGDVQNANKETRLWEMITTSAIRLIVYRKGNQILDSNLPIYSAKKQGANNNVLRAYYAFLGNEPDGTPLYGLVAAFRTKDPQDTVMRILLGKSRKSGP